MLRLPPLLLRSVVRTSTRPPCSGIARQWRQFGPARPLHSGTPLRLPAPTSPILLRAVFRRAAPPAPAKAPAALPDSEVSSDGRINASRPEGSGKAIPISVMDQLRGDPELYARFVNAEAPNPLRALLVALGLAGTCYVAGAWWSVVEEEKAQALRSWSGMLLGRENDYPRWTAGALRLQRACEFLALPERLRLALYDVYSSCFRRYRDLPPYSQDAMPIIALNTGVFLLWTLSKMPAAVGLRRLMNRAFLDVPSSRRHWTMLTSSFSHFGLFHFGMNNFALLSFGSLGFASAAWYSSHGVRAPSEASHVPHLFAFAGAVGVLSALAFHVQGAVNFRMLARRSGHVYAKARIGIQNGLGSSGWIYGAMTLTVMTTPDVRLHIFFLPQFEVSGKEGMLGLCLLDVFCILFRFQFLAHWVHLTGAALGYAYFHHGLALWEATRARVREVRARLGQGQPSTKHKGARRGATEPLIREVRALPEARHRLV